MIKLNTKLLFYQLLPVLRPVVVYDVGSLDGTHAMRFRKLVPDARVMAFEANPRNIESLEMDEAFQAAGIELIGAAVGDQNGRATFYLEELNEEETWR